MREINWAKTGIILLIWQGVVAVAAIVMTGGVIIVMRGRLPPQIPLFYSRPWGEEQLSQPWGMMWAVATVCLAWCVSWLISKTCGREKILAAFVAGAGLLSEIVIMLGLIRIVMIIT